MGNQLPKASPRVKLPSIAGKKQGGGSVNPIRRAEQYTIASNVGVSVITTIPEASLGFCTILPQGMNSSFTDNTSDVLQESQMYVNNLFASGGFVAASARRPLAGAALASVNFEIIEWNPAAVRSVQMINATPSGTGDRELAITPVDPAKTMLFMSGHESNGTSLSTQMMKVSLSSESTVLIQRNTAQAGNAPNCIIQIVEFK